MFVQEQLMCAAEAFRTFGYGSAPSPGQYGWMWVTQPPRTNRELLAIASLDLLGLIEHHVDGQRFRIAPQARRGKMPVEDAELREEADDIVRQLAEESPIDEDDGETRCHYCGIRFDGNPHFDTCLWLRAKKYVEAEAIVASIEKHRPPKSRQSP